MDRTKKSKGRRVTIVETDSVVKKATTTDEKDNRNVTEVARSLVEDVIADAAQIVEDARNPKKNIKWLTHGEFTAERGRRQIDKYVSIWDYQRRWVHYTEFIKREDLIHSFRYIYCVRWSVPTARLPVPRANAAAHFTIKVNKSKPPDMPVDVSFIFEGQSLVLRPGTIRFREKWMRDIIEAKHVLMESIPF